MLLITSLVFVLCINFLLFCFAYKYQSDKLTDFAYALSFIMVAFSAMAFSDKPPALLRVIVVMVVLWALRLGVFLVIRIRKIGKDSRFDGVRENFFKFLKFWLGQGVVAWVLLLPLLLLAERDNSATTLTFVGIGIWLVGLFTETTADLQKYRFTQSPANKNKWIDSGLWHYSLHPNYFGEILVWIGVYLTIYTSLDTFQKLIGLVSPVTIFIILRFVSGVPLLEKSALERWGDDPDYRAHIGQTNLLVPFWPRQKGSKQ